MIATEFFFLGGATKIKNSPYISDWPLDQYNSYLICTISGEVALPCTIVEGGREINPHVWHILSWRFGHENISTAILSTPQIQIVQFSVNGKRMCTKYFYQLSYLVIAANFNYLPLQIRTLKICNHDISKSITARSFKLGQLIEDDV